MNEFIAILSILKKAPYWTISFKITKGPYLSHLASNQENKGTLFFKTFKVGENKVALFS